MASDGNECAAEAFRFQALAKDIAAELLAKFDLPVLNMNTEGAWPQCADIDPAESGRVDRIGIPQRKKTGSRTAAMGPKGDIAAVSGDPTPETRRSCVLNARPNRTRNP
jgi:hypothetical protein